MIASDEDDAYKQFAEACGEAWSPKAAKNAAAITKAEQSQQDAVKTEEAIPSSSPVAVKHFGEFAT